MIFIYTPGKFYAYLIKKILPRKKTVLFLLQLINLRLEKKKENIIKKLLHFSILNPNIYRESVMCLIILLPITLLLRDLSS